MGLASTIRSHSPAMPVLIVVSSRRQTRLTALELIAFLATEDDPKQWLHQDKTQMTDIIATVRESNLKLTLAFGIGMHHTGLHQRDRKTVEELYVNYDVVNYSFLTSIRPPIRDDCNTVSVTCRSNRGCVLSSYNSLDDISHETINKFLSNLVERSLRDLECSYCMEIGEDDCTIEALTYSRISSYYYLKHQTVRMFKERLRAELPIQDILSVLTDAEEYGELPDSAHIKTHLLLQAHFSREQLPCSAYGTDTKTVMDNAIRICQAMLDVAANEGWLVTALSICNLVQMIIQGRWLNESSILTLPTIEQQHLYLGFPGPIEGLPELVASCKGRENTFAAILGEELQPHQISQAWSFLSHLPVVEVRLSVKGWWEGCGEDQRSWLDVHADQEYVLQVSLQRINTGYKTQAPRFPKNKDEGWFLVLGEVERRELLAVKRIGYCRHRSTVSLAFYTPEKTGKCIYTLYLMSDSYLGLDQQYDLHLNMTPACIAAQVNSEVTEAMGGMSVK
uniref:SEC63 domain-containing protein n=1 Tax=Oncorhynchus tshawytscha TaxID=74940 RepID=A0AAZ3NMD5_ONCTS